jgi:hypothetical protein
VGSGRVGWGAGWEAVLKCGEQFVCVCKCIPRLATGSINTPLPVRRDLIGDSAVIGDSRWGGSWGIQADFLARNRCCVVSIRLADLQVTHEILVVTAPSALHSLHTRHSMHEFNRSAMRLKSTRCQKEWRCTCFGHASVCQINLFPGGSKLSVAWNSARFAAE